MAQTPMKKLVRKGLKMYTVDYVNNETLVAESPNEEAARWVFNSLAMYHKVSTEETSQAELDFNK